MKAVILAAGLCKRIRQVTGGRPKCLLQVGRRTILDYQLESLFKAGINSVAIVVGYGKEHIINHIAERRPDKLPAITFIENPQFAFTNNIYSLWLAQEWVGGADFLCLNADVLFHPQIILPAITTQADISVIIDEEWRDETMKVIIKDSKVLAMSKAIPREQFSGTYVNITTFSRRICRPFFGAMDSLITQGRVNDFFNVAVEQLIADGVTVSFTQTNGLPWAEVDDPSDLYFARTNVYPKLVGQSAFGQGIGRRETQLKIAARS